MEHYKEKYESLLRDIDIAIAGQKEGETKTVLQNLKERHTESENERIRKGLIHYFKEQDGILTAISGNVSTRDVLAWLGKQGEQIDAIENFDTEFEKQVSYLIASTINKEHEYNEGFVKWTANALLNYAKHELEKQGEQKSEINDNILLRFAFYQYDDDTLYLSSVFVEECNRKHGYGSKILKAAEEVAKTFGISKIRLKVERNTWMEEWYKKNGYDHLSPDGEYDWLEKQVEQTITDKVEPKSDIEKGKWYVCNTSRYRDFVVGKAYFCPKNGMLKPSENEMARYVDRNCFHLWTIQDAKKGDILQANKCTLIFDSLAKDIDGNTVISSWYYCDTHTFYGMGPSQPDLWVTEGVVPSTKEQRDFLFQKMKEAGYEWDVEKKELKKVEQKPAWSEEDETRLGSIKNTIRWAAASGYDMPSVCNVHKKNLEWLDSLKERYSWKPSDEQSV